MPERWHKRGTSAAHVPLASVDDVAVVGGVRAMQ